MGRGDPMNRPAAVQQVGPTRFVGSMGTFIGGPGRFDVEVVGPNHVRFVEGPTPVRSVVRVVGVHPDDPVESARAILEWIRNDPNIRPILWGGR
jgi:hypothetical protein